MSSLWRDARYQQLAHRAAGKLSPHPGAIAAGILALWSCEQPSPAPWPPIHNNPGNLTRHVGNLDGEPHHLATTTPGRNLLYVYGSPEAGADAFAHYIARSSRYAIARAAAQAGSPRAFVHAVTAAGYGTREGCATDVLDRILGAAPPADTHAYVCEGRSVFVRSSASRSSRAVGRVKHGEVVHGHPVTGDPYQAGGSVRHAWIKLGTNRYTAAAYYRRAT